VLGHVEAERFADFARGFANFEPSVTAPAGTFSPAGTSPNRLSSGMHLEGGHPLLPIAALLAGVFLLIAPRVVSFAVAVFLIFVGILGLNGIYHFIQ
jgi:hypothetical protein